MKGFNVKISLPQFGLQQGDFCFNVLIFGINH